MVVLFVTRRGPAHGEVFPAEVKRGRRGHKYIAITFDGGGNIGATRLILEILREKEIRCTIFLT
jgi:peptidoglycan/xylan/chitin deacetylase (PgdA/CDA1 family)